MNGIEVREPRPLFVDRDDLLARMKLCINDFSPVFTDLEMKHVPCDEGHLSQEESITGIVSFEGTYKGHVWARCSEPFAQFMAGRLKNAEEQMFESHVRKVVGEVAHILGGELKLFLSPGGRKIQLSLPHVFKGKEFDRSGFETVPNHLSCSFQYGHERLQIGVVLRK